MDCVDGSGWVFTRSIFVENGYMKHISEVLKEKAAELAEAAKAHREACDAAVAAPSWLVPPLVYGSHAWHEARSLGALDLCEDDAGNGRE